jgi:nicotinamidase-related amidase
MRPRHASSPPRLACWAATLLLLAGSSGPLPAGEPSAPTQPERLALRLRSQRETADGGGKFRPSETSASWDPRSAAIIVCDMWDLHHSLNATLRLKEMAPRLDQTLRATRARGVLIIHAPSGCMETYRDHPARTRATAIPLSRDLPEDIGKWCYQIPSEARGTYPIDQQKGENDDEPAAEQRWLSQLEAMGRDPARPWKSETELLTIDPDVDMISDKGEEIWSILEARRIEHVMLTGVHTNMCVLGRPFGLRQMARNGKDVVLLRDLTDTIYNPERAPFVDHFAGTALIVEHIEKYVCPTITSDQILGGATFRFRGDDQTPATSP